MSVFAFVLYCMSSYNPATTQKMCDSFAPGSWSGERDLAGMTTVSHIFQEEAEEVPTCWPLNL